MAPPALPPADADRGSEGVRAVVRALQLLHLMNAQPAWTLQELHRACGLPKATLSRLLATLRQEGYVAAEATPGRYRLTPKVRELGRGYTETDRLLDGARPILLRVTRQIKWPLALATLDGDAMVVRFSSMPYSPLAVHTTTLGHRLGLLDSALGRAFLAGVGDALRRTLLDGLYASAPAHLAAWPRTHVEHDLAQVRAAGHAVRQPNAQRGSATLAVAVRVGEEAVAALSMTTFGRSLTPATIDEHRPVLDETARSIAAAFEPAA